MKIDRLAATSEALRQTSSRNEKSALLAKLLSDLDSNEIESAIGFMLAKPRQGAIGVGWAALQELNRVSNEQANVSQATLADAPELVELDELLSTLATTTGPGSEALRKGLLHQFLARCTQSEASFVRQVLIGESRQGALAGVMTDAAAKASGVSLRAFRRAVMLIGDLGRAAKIALTEGNEAINAVDLRVGRPIEPMLAATATTAEEALAKMPVASVEWKLDGARIQVHIMDPPSTTGGADEPKPNRVEVYTRNLNDIGARLPDVVRIAQSLDCQSAVIDGEVLGFFSPSGEEKGQDQPTPFQETMSTFGQHGEVDSSHRLQPFFFDLMFLNGQSLVDKPLLERRSALAQLAPDHVVAQIVVEPQTAGMTRATAQANRHLQAALENGHEGIMVKDGLSPYKAGRRGKTWLKIKPVHTLDLVVLAAEWGHGRRQGWLSNLHLGALDSETGQVMMVGKTFKGLTDKLLAWQTAKFLSIKTSTSPDGHTVYVQPELVIEIAVDGAQVSRRYPGGVALRFARVRSYRPDRDHSTINTIQDIKALL